MLLLAAHRPNIHSCVTLTRFYINNIILSVFYWSSKSDTLTSQASSRYFDKGKTKNIMEVQQISDRLQLHRALSHNEWEWPVDPKRILVLFFTWLGAKEKHIEKYRNLYTNLGLDVLTVKSVHTDFLWPPNSVKLAKHTLKALDERFREYDHIIPHSMSIGSYNLTVLCMTARKLNSRKHLVAKFRGIIFDSIVVGSNKGGIIKGDDSSEIQVYKHDVQSIQAIDRMIQGMAKGISGNSYIQSFIAVLAKMYFSATKKQTLDFYEKALDIARDEPLKVPTVVFASRDDPMSDAATLEKLIEVWQTNSNLPVTLHLWESSPHAQHLVFHREEYEAACKRFFTHVFPNSQGNSSSINKSKL